MDFPAKKAREITNKHEYYNATMWYQEYKYKLFERIKAEALKGNNSLVLNRDDWERNVVKEEYLKSELLEHEYNWSMVDGDIIISW
jgi:hypothetical protein